MTISPIDFIHDFMWADLPDPARSRVTDNLLDLIGVAVGGHSTRASQIMRDFAADQMPGPLPMLFDGRGCSAAGVALAAGMTIDALDGHDGFNPAKGHIGCVLFATILPVAVQRGATGRAFLEALAMGYEFGARASLAQHGTVPDYHTSGSWGAVTAAAACARLMSLNTETTRHALGIAEYHGPRSQMMRCIDHPTMVKDGAGWGALSGVSAAGLAASGFTGAPAITVEEAPEFWSDLGDVWHVAGQYYKPYPVCRWAQAPIEGILALRMQHGLSAQMVDRITVTTFHESVRLATATPRTTEEAQYSTSFPCAVAMVRGDVTPADIADDALDDPEVLRLSQSLVMVEEAIANAVFPAQRIAKVALTLTDGRELTTEWLEPKWDPSSPPSTADLRAKFDGLAVPMLGKDHAAAVADAIAGLDGAPFSGLADLISQPISD